MTISTAFAGMPATRDLSGQWYAVMGIDRDQPTNYGSAESFARAPADEAWVASCIRRLYQSAQSVPLRVYVRAGKDLVPAAEDGTTDGADELQALLDYVAPFDMTGAVEMTGPLLRAYTIASYAAWGECYWLKVRGIHGGPPLELHWLRAPDLATPTDDGVTVREYQYRPRTGGGGDYRPRDVVAFRTPNLLNPLRGLSPLSAVRSEMTTLQLWSERLAAGQANDSIPPGYWQIPQQAQFTKQDESLVRRTLRALRERRNRGRTPIMPQGIDFKSIALTPHDAEMVAQGKMSRMAVCAALGVPLVLAGDDDKNTVYGNLRDAKRLFWTDTMIPLLQWYADAVNKSLVPEYDVTRRRLTVAFDLSGVEALRPVWDVEWNAYMNGVYAQVVVPNEVRRHFRIGPDVPWGDQPVPRTAVAIRPAPDALDPANLAGYDPADVATLPQAVDDTSGGADVADVIRSFGPTLYKHPAVRAWVADPTQALDLQRLVGSVGSDAARVVIETGLRRRDPARTIADELAALAVA